MDKVKPLTTPLLFLAVLLIALPLMDLAGSLWPVALDSPEWRFEAVDLLSHALLRPLIGSFTLVLLATRGHRKRLRGAMSVLNGLAAAVLIVALPVFLLDSLELQRGVPAESRLALDLAAVRDAVALGLALVVLATLSRVGFRSGRVRVDPGRVSDTESASSVADQRRARSSEHVPLLAPDR